MEDKIQNENKILQVARDILRTYKQEINPKDLDKQTIGLLERIRKDLSVKQTAKISIQDNI